MNLIKSIKKNKIFSLLALGICLFLIVDYNKKLTIFKEKINETSVHIPSTLDINETLHFQFSKRIIRKSLCDSLFKTDKIKISPHIKGSFSWKKTNLLTFLPEELYNPATKYSVIIDPHFTDDYYFSLIGENEFFFETPRLKVNDISYSIDGNIDYPLHTIKFIIEFNLPVRKENLLENLIIFDDNDKAVTYDIISNDHSSIKQNRYGHRRYYNSPQSKFHHEVVIHTPSGENKEYEYQLNIKNNLLPIDGQFGMNNDYIDDKTIEKLGDLSITYVNGFTNNENNSGIEIRFNYYINKHDISNYITTIPRVNDMVINGNYNLLTLNGSFLPNTKYTLAINKNIRTLRGHKLSESFTQSISIPALQPFLEFGLDGMYLLKNGNRNLQVISSGIRNIDMEIYRIYENNVDDFAANLNQKKYYRHRNKNDRFGNIIFNENIILDSLNYGEDTTTLNIDQFINNEKGIYQIKLFDKNRRYRNHKQWVILTDIGIITKETDNNLWVFTHNLSNTQPMKNVKIKLISYNQQEIFNGYTDDEGKLVINNYKEMKHNSNPFLVVAKQNDDFSFLNLKKDNISYEGADIGGSRLLDHDYLSYSYTDRGVYRPGDTLNLVTIIRDGLANNHTKKLPISLKIMAPDESIFAERTIITDSQGMIEFNSSIPKYAVTGNYTAKISVADKVIGWKYFQVEAFMPDRIKVNLISDKKRVHKDETFSITTSAKTMYGTFAKNFKVDLKCKLEPLNFKHKKYPGFIFNDKYKNYNGTQWNIATGHIGNDGKYVFPFVLSQEKNIASNVKAIFTSTVKEHGGRSVSDFEVINIYALKEFLGIKCLNKQFNVNDQIIFNTILSDFNGDLISGEEVTVLIYKEETETIRIKRKRGGYSNQRNTKEFLTQTYTYMTENTIKKITLDIPESGRYKIIFKHINSDNSITYNFNTRRAYRENWVDDIPEKLLITLDKDEYQAGDTAWAHIKSPFSGRYLLTIESNEILFYDSNEIESNNFYFPILINENYFPNVYLSLNIIRPPGGLEEYENARALGTIPLKINRSAKEINITLEHEHSIKPGRPFTVKYNLDNIQQETHLTLALIDEGILQLTEYEKPDPFDTFYPKKALLVKHYDIYSNLLPEINSRSIIGGDGSYFENRNIDQSNQNNGVIKPPLPRKHVSLSGVNRVKPVALWSGIISHNNGENSGSYTFSIPNYNGTLRLVAVAVSDNQFGSIEQNVVVKDNIIITPSYPRFLTTNDTCVIPVQIHNATGIEGLFKVNFILDNNSTHYSPSEKSVQINNNETEVVIFKMVAPHIPVPIQSKIIVYGNAYKSDYDVNISIEPSYPVFTNAVTGIAEKNKPFLEKFPGDWIKGTDEYLLNISGFPEMQMSNSLSYLLRYPYGCVEQTTSKIFPLLYFNEISKKVEPELFQNNGSDYYINEGIKRLQTMQLYNGSFRYWSRGDLTYDWTSIYVAHFLVEARINQKLVPDQMYNNAIHFLKIITGYQSGKVLKNKAYANYVLSLAQQPDINSIHYSHQNELEELDYMGRLYLAASLSLLGEKEDALNMILSKSINNQDFEHKKYRFHSSVSYKALKLDILRRLSPDNNQIPTLIKDIFNSTTKHGRWSSTQDNIYVLLSLGKYLKETENTPPVGRIIIDGEKVIPFKGDFQINSSKWANRDWKVIVDGGGKAFITSAAAGIPLYNKQRLEDQGISVRRKYFTLDNDPIEKMNFKQGSLYLTEVTIMALQEPLNNIMIVDKLPAGLEIENSRLATRDKIKNNKSKINVPDFIDFRDDRVLIATSLHRIDKEYVYRYTVRAITEGNFTLPAIFAEAMYDPLVYSAHGQSLIRVNKE